MSNTVIKSTKAIKKVIGKLKQQKFINLAYEQAKLALQQDEVPVGAVLVMDGEVLAATHNLVVTNNNPCAHAEILAITQATQQLANYRLINCEIYVTLEPCAMCLGALLHARVKKIIFAVTDEKAGACGGVVNLASNNKLNHHSQVINAEQLGDEYLIWSKQCKSLLQKFFQQKRLQQKAKHIPLLTTALRSSDKQFKQLPLAKLSQFTNKLPELQNLQMHYIDSGNANRTKINIVALHPLNLWSHCFTQFIQATLIDKFSLRWLVPDFIGFGQSDKWKKTNNYSLQQQKLILHSWLDSLQLVAPIICLLPFTEAQLYKQLLEGYLPKIKLIVLPKQWQLDMWQLFKQLNLIDIPFENKGYRVGYNVWQQFLQQQSNITMDSKYEQLYQKLIRQNLAIEQINQKLIAQIYLDINS